MTAGQESVFSVIRLAFILKEMKAINPGISLVSIGVPVYNGSTRIAAALNSILAQTYKNIEVIISDNASTDDTEKVCEEYCKNNVSFRYIRQEKNFGPTKNFETVLHNAKGKYFMWLGDDDWLSPEYVSECIRHLESDESISLVCGEAVYYQNGVEQYRGSMQQLTDHDPSKRVIGYYKNVSDNGTFYGLMRREQLLQVPIRNVIGGDWLLIASIAFIGKVITLSEIQCNRSLGNATVTYENIARTLNLPAHHGKYPHLVIAYFAFKEAISSEIYILRASRIKIAILGLNIFQTIRCRHGCTMVGVLKSFIRRRAGRGTLNNILG